MLRYILFDTTLFGEGDKDIHETRQDLMWIQEALVKRNQNYLKQRPSTPPLYRSGVRYMLPNQFDGEPEEVSILRAALGDKLKDPRVANVIDTCMQVFGGERFRDIGRIIENGGGDCLPVETLVETPDGPRPIGDLKVGDKLATSDYNRSGFVSKVWPRAVKPTITLFLSNGERVVSSLEHRHYAVRKYPLEWGQPTFWEAGTLSIGDVVRVRKTGSTGAVITAIETTAPRECVDITTTSHEFILAKSGVITHNCDNLAAWRVAELRQAGIEAMSYMTNRRRSDGGTTYHALVLWPPFANVPYVTSEDPSLLLGMSQPDRKADRDEEIRKNKERCDLIRRYGIKPVSGTPSGGGFDGDVEDVLGLRRRLMRYVSLPPDVAEVARIARRGA